MPEVQVEQVIQVVTIVFAVVPQVAAIFGAPAWMSKFMVVSKVFNLLAGNFGKAKNAK